MMNGLTIIPGDGNPSIFDRKILRRVSLKEGPTGEGVVDGPSYIACIVDVETTGLSLEEDVIIEFALRRVHFDADGIVIGIEAPHVWQEDPGIPIPEEVVRLTGIGDADVFGRRIDEDAALELMFGSDIVIAHWSAFDKPFLARRMEPIVQMRWGCSCIDIDWAHNGYDGRGLGWLCSQAGWFFDGHRALADVDAVITLLRRPARDYPSLLAEVVDNAWQPRVLVEAVGSEIELKERLKQRGYRWNPSKPVWEREIREVDCIKEEVWLADNVYSVWNNAKAPGPLISKVPYERRFL